MRPSVFLGGRSRETTLVSRAGSRASPSPLSPASDLGAKYHQQRELKPVGKEKPLQEQGIAACVQTLAQKQELLGVSLWGL